MNWQWCRGMNSATTPIAITCGHWGRGVGVTLALAMLFGKDSEAANIGSNMFLGMEMRYSQRQERAAEAFGLDLLEAGYGHVGGATEFFSVLPGRREANIPTYLHRTPIRRQGFPRSGH